MRRVQIPAPVSVAPGLTLAWVLASTLALPACAQQIYASEVRAAEILYATTDDGWRLALHHFPVPEGAAKKPLPVIICHGLSSNKNNWDLTNRLSFPSYLAERGYDTYAVELRGSGASDHPTWFGDKDWDYALDDYILRDLPALVNYVRTRTGSEQVHWVGHSMGGIVLYGYLQRVQQTAIRSATVVASPMYILDHNHNLNRSIRLIPMLALLFDAAPFGSVTRMLAPFAHVPVLDDMRIIWNYDNVAPETAKMASANAVDDFGVGVLTQLGQSFEKDRLLSADGEYDYSEGMGKIRVPIFFVAGAQDQLAPPALLAEAYRRVASEDKRIEVFSRANGHAHDYGHVDLVLGETAPEEVFPVLLDWIEAHD